MRVSYGLEVREMKTRKDIKLWKDEKFVEDIREENNRCPKCGGLLIAKFGAGISVEFCVEDNCDYEDYDYDLS
jgi:ribosomal protein S27AE